LSQSFAGLTPTPVPSPGPTPYVPTSDSIQIPGFTLYTLQAGVFRDLQNAEACANQLQERGGAGWVVEDADGFHVLLSAYPTQEDAQTVQAQLQTDNVTSAVYPLVFAPVQLTVSGSAAQARAMENTLMVWRTVCMQLGTTAILQDTDAYAVADAGAAYADELRFGAEDLSDADAWKARAMHFAQALEELGNQSQPAQAARMLQLQMTQELVDWVDGLISM